MSSVVDYVNTHAPFVKAILISEFINDSEVFRYMSEDIELAEDPSQPISAEQKGTYQ